MQTLSLQVLAAAFCAAALWGCGGEAPAPSPFEAAWANHFDAFGMGVAAQDDEDPTNGNTAALDKIMLDYDDESVVRLYDYSAADPKLSTYSNRAEIRAMFDGLFPALKGCNGDGDTQLKAKVDVDEAGGQVFLVWSCEATSFYRATDTFIFEGVTIRNQNIVVAKTASLAANSLVQFRRLQEYNPQNVADAWANHADAFMAGAAAGGSPARNQTAMEEAVTKIMLDYDDQSVVRLFTQNSGLTNEFDVKTGTSEISEMFTGLFQSFTSPTPPVVPQALVVEDPKQVFLIWAGPDSGYDEATDTFIFSDDFKINRQNIALFTPTL